MTFINNKLYKVHHVCKDSTDVDSFKHVLDRSRLGSVIIISDSTDKIERVDRELRDISYVDLSDSDLVPGVDYIVGRNHDEILYKAYLMVPITTDAELFKGKCDESINMYIKNEGPTFIEQIVDSGYPDIGSLFYLQQKVVNRPGECFDNTINVDIKQLEYIIKRD